MPINADTLTENLFDQGNDRFLQDRFGEVVVTVIADGIPVMLLEEVIGVHLLVVDAEEAVGVLPVEIGDALELGPFHHVEMLDRVPCYRKLLLIVLSPVQELVGTCLESVGHMRHIEGWIHAYLPEPEHLLGVHPAHRCAYYQVRILLRAVCLEIRQGLLRVYGDIRSNDFILRHQTAERIHCAGGAGRGEAMEIDYLHRIQS